MYANGSVYYYGSGQFGPDNPVETTGTWAAEAGVNAELYQVRWNIDIGYGAPAWLDLSANVGYYVDVNNYGDYSALLEIRHKETNNIISSFTLRINVT